MQQQHNQLQANHQTKPQSLEQTSLAGLTKNSIMAKFDMTEQEWSMYDAELSLGLLTLRTAFPAQARNFSEREHDMLSALWQEIFAEAEPGMLREAIMRFISADRKGFFPSPGQIMGIIEDITAEREKQAAAKKFEQYYFFNRKRQSINNGENCPTCRFSEQRETQDIGDKTKKTNMFCQNPDSPKHGGETTADILWECYGPKNENPSGCDI
jgi:hypothetical protein